MTEKRPKKLPEGGNFGESLSEHSYFQTPKSRNHQRKNRYTPQQLWTIAKQSFFFDVGDDFCIPKVYKP
jgi:hypothetical protein